MIKKLFAVVLLAGALVSCGGKKAAYNYSQDIVAKERSLEPQITLTESQVEKYASAQQFDSMAAVSERMEKLVQKKIDEIEAMKMPKAKEVDNFRAAIMRYFKYIKSIYTGYKDVAKAETPEERQKLAQELVELANKKNEEIREMQEVQRKYAKANGFRVEN